MLPEFYQFHHPTKVIYGEGLVSDFSHEVEELNAKRYFVVSDQVLNNLGLVQKVTEGLKLNPSITFLFGFFTCHIFNRISFSKVNIHKL